jgi:hypothetical protein
MLDPLPRGRVAWTDPRLKQGWLVLALAAAAYALVFPFTVSISDEAFYAGQTLALLHGHLVPTVADALPIQAGHAAEALRYPPGWPLLLAPFRLLGFRPMFVAALLMHLLGGAVVARMLVRRGLPAWLAAAWVFHPVAWIFSRTLMSDVPAVTLLLLAMDQWEEGKPGRSAFALGYSLFARVASLMAAAGVGLAVLADGRWRWRDLFVLALGPLAAGVAVVAFNRATQGSALGTWYGTEGVNGLTGQSVPQHLLLYAGGLLLLPPFPLACLLLRPRRCDRWALAALPPLAFFVFYSYHDASASALETFVGGQRLVLAVHAVLLVSTMRVWSKLPPLRFRAPVLALAAACAVTLSFLSRKKLEERFIPAIQTARGCRPEHLAFNDLALRVAAAVPARTYSMVTRDAPLPPADVGIVLTHELTRNPRAVGRSRVPAAWAATGRCTRAGAFLVFDLRGGCDLPPPACALPPPGPAR